MNILNGEKTVDEMKDFLTQSYSSPLKETLLECYYVVCRLLSMYDRTI